MPTQRVSGVRYMLTLSSHVRFESQPVYAVSLSLLFLTAGEMVGIMAALLYLWYSSISDWEDYLKSL